MKRTNAILLSLVLLAVTLFGCTQAGQPEQPKAAKKSIVCTIFPQYDWVRQILGEKVDDVDLTLLLSSKTDLHNYQPSVDDIVKISACDLFIHVGGESDEWVEDALAQATNPNMVAVNLMEVLGDAAKLEELMEGEEHDHEHDEDEDHDEDHDAEHDEEEAEYDEHVWLSLKNAQVFCTAIADALITINPENAVEYQANLAGYTAKLSALDAEYQSAVASAPMKTLLFGDRFPFRYLVDDYGLTYDTAFAGCSAETEASFETIARLAKRADEWKLHTIIVTESADKSIAETIIKETANKNQQILVLDAMQSVTASDVQNGTTYRSIMESNLAVLKDALR